jgi:hypothetical protein
LRISSIIPKHSNERRRSYEAANDLQASRLEVQLVFKGELAGWRETAWDNNGGRNWGLALDMVPDAGLSAAHPQAVSQV